MTRIFALLLLLGSFAMPASAQSIAMKKGVILDSLPLKDSVARDLTLYLPPDFEPSRNWPLLFVCPEEESVTQTMRYLKASAASNGYVMASSKAIQDSLTLTMKLLVINKSLEKLKELLPLDNARIYTAGYHQGGQLAVLVPSLIRDVTGVLSVASILPNAEFITSKNPFDFVGIMGRSDYQYLSLNEENQFLDQRKIPNHILYHGGGHQWPEEGYIGQGLQALSLMAMKKKGAIRDTVFIATAYETFRDRILELEAAGSYLLAMNMTVEAESLFDDLADTDWLKWKRKDLKGQRGYKDRKRDWDKVVLNERILIDDYIFYLDEDVMNFNLNNLGWWNHQMGKINEYKASPKKEEQLSGLRLEGFVNALIGDYIQVSAMGPKPDDDALIFLYMLKTITAPSEAYNYLRVISLTAKYSDFGTANFYLEELLKKGYEDEDRLYNLPHTGLLRISPEFNTIIARYLGEARYPVEE